MDLPFRLREIGGDEQNVNIELRGKNYPSYVFAPVFDYSTQARYLGEVVPHSTP